MGKPAAFAQIQRQERLVGRLEKVKVELRNDTRENNKKLDTETIKLRCMISGNDPPDLFSQDGEDGEDGPDE